MSTLRKWYFCTYTNKIKRWGILLLCALLYILKSTLQRYSMRSAMNTLYIKEKYMDRFINVFKKYGVRAAGHSGEASALLFLKHMSVSKK